MPQPLGYVIAVLRRQPCLRERVRALSTRQAKNFTRHSVTASRTSGMAKAHAA